MNFIMRKIFNRQKLLQDIVDDIRNYIIEQRVQIETKSKFLKKSKVRKDFYWKINVGIQPTEFSNRTHEDQRPPPPPPVPQPQQQPIIRSSHSKHRKVREKQRVFLFKFFDLIRKVIVYPKHMTLVVKIHFNYLHNRMKRLIILYKNLKIILLRNLIGQLNVKLIYFLLKKKSSSSLTKQRITLNSSNHHDERSTSYHIEPPKKVLRYKKLIYN